MNSCHHKPYVLGGCSSIDYPEDIMSKYNTSSSRINKSHRDYLTTFILSI